MSKPAPSSSRSRPLPAALACRLSRPSGLLSGAGSRRPSSWAAAGRRYVLRLEMDEWFAGLRQKEEAPHGST